MSRPRGKAVLSRIKRKAGRVLHRIQGRQYVHLLHVGKTGGTAIKYVLSEYPARRRYIVCLHQHGFRLRDIPEGECFIFFLRDPVSRFVSGFHSRQRQGRPRYFSPWSPAEKEAFEEFRTPDELAAALSSPDVTRKERAEQAMKSIFHVNSSFWDWFENERYFQSRLSDVFFIGFQETLSEDFRILASKLGLPDDIELPKDDMKAHKNPKGLDRTLGDEAVANLRKWYQDDYQFLRWCRDLIADNLVPGGSVISYQGASLPGQSSVPEQAPSATVGHSGTQDTGC